MKTNYLTVLTLGLFITFISNRIEAQNIGINATGNSPDLGAMLDVSSTDKGVLLPRVNITNINTIAPITGSTTTGMLVYNTNTSTGEGYYFWDGSEWKRFALNGEAWKLTGNAGTNANTNFLGTTDNNSLAFRTNNTERMRVLANGKVAVNSTGTFGTSTFFSSATGNDNAIDGSAAGTGNAIYGQNIGSGNAINGLSNNSDGYSLRSSHLSPTGTAALFTGQNSIGYAFPSGSGIAVNGMETAILTIAQANNGWGVKGAGNNITSLGILTEGGGGAFTGEQWGVYGQVNETGATNRASVVGRYTNTSGVDQNVYLGAVNGGVDYKVLGTGGASVSTTMETRDGERILFAPEAPENWFFDLGEVQLTDGKATVYLDPLFVDVISEEKPFKVFIQGGENTMGSIRVSRNQEEKSFTVEDLGGASDGVVQFKVYAIWKNKENIRFPKYERPNNHKKEKLQKDNREQKAPKELD